MSNNRSSIEEVYRILSHKSAKNMGYTFRSAGKMNLGTAKMIREVVEERIVCRQISRLRSRSVMQ